VQNARVTRSKLASKTETTTTSTALPSKVGNSRTAAVPRKRAALGDVTNAHTKPALADITNAILKKEPEKPAVKRPIAKKTSTVNVKKLSESRPPLASKQTSTSVVIPKKRPSEAVAPPRRTLVQSTSSTLVQKNNATHAAPPRRRHEEVSADPEAPRKKQKIEQKQDWDDLDAADALDPIMVSEYVVEIFDYLRELEVLS
jgi:G2/mitotic-specific cyclin 2